MTISILTVSIRTINISGLSGISYTEALLCWKQYIKNKCVIMLSVIMLSVIMLSVLMLSGVMLSFVMLNSECHYFVCRYVE
jgi:hypothetical protein